MIKQLILILLYLNHEMCDRVVYKDPFLIVYCPNKYISQKMCDEAVDDSLAALQYIPNLFVTNEVMKKDFYYFVC